MACPHSADPEAGGAQQGYEVVIMDLGSARAKRLEVGNRVEALALQEDAEVGGWGGG